MTKTLREIYADLERQEQTVLTTHEVADRLGLRVRAVQLLIRNGTLPAERVGRRRYEVRESDLPFAEARRKVGRPRKPAPEEPDALF